MHLKKATFLSTYGSYAHKLCDSTTKDRKFAVVDVFVAMGVSINTNNAGTKLRRLVERVEEVQSVISEHKFPGPGQRSDTKVADEEVSKRAPLRDVLTPVELGGVNMSELMTIGDMEEAERVTPMDIYAMASQNAKLVGEMMRKKRELMKKK